MYGCPLSTSNESLILKNVNAGYEKIRAIRETPLVTGADRLYFSARAQFDQTGPQIVENVNQWAEILRNANVSMLSRTYSLRAAGPSGILPNFPTGQSAPGW